VNNSNISHSVLIVDDDNDDDVHIVGSMAIRPWPHHGFREGLVPLPRLHKELLKVGL